MKRKGQRHIDRQTYLQALGLFTIARGHQQKCTEAEHHLAELLHITDAGGYAGHVSDEIYGDGNFDAALKREEIVVSPKKFRRSKP